MTINLYYVGIDPISCLYIYSFRQNINENNKSVRLAVQLRHKGELLRFIRRRAICVFRRQQTMLLERKVYSRGLKPTKKNTKQSIL